jgi:hypothetical protein
VRAVSAASLTSEVVALLKAVSRRLARVDVNDLAGNLLYAVLPTLTWLRVSPNPLMARYNVHVVIMLVVATAWLLSKGAWLRVREQMPSSYGQTEGSMYWLRA